MTLLTCCRSANVRGRGRDGSFRISTLRAIISPMSHFKSHNASFLSNANIKHFNSKVSVKVQLGRFGVNFDFIFQMIKVIWFPTFRIVAMDEIGTVLGNCAHWSVKILIVMYTVDKKSMCTIYFYFIVLLWSGDCFLLLESSWAQYKNQISLNTLIVYS